jgi:hypothetical protein
MRKTKRFSKNLNELAIDARTFRKSRNQFIRGEAITPDSYAVSHGV